IDTAAAYGNEADVGRAILESGVDRNDIFVTTKLWVDDEGYDEALIACQKSLYRLQLDYLDLYLIHWPSPGQWQHAWKAMERLLKEGKCRAVGVSNFQIHHLDEIQAMSDIVPAVNQVEFSPFLYRRDLLEYCQQNNIQLEAYSSLTRGGKLNDPRVVDIAKKYGKSPAQVLLRWPLQHGIIIIPKSTHPDRIRTNADIFDFSLSEDDMAILDNMNEDFYTTPAGWRAKFE
ncbi:MAG TPA: aldo/keto reductase, partial [Armatimonadota bacterium]|nr:aldo/keto reductase [Armatimonadota bacterium]